MDIISLKTEMEFRGYSKSTQRTYTRTVKDFLNVVNKDTLEIKKEDVIEYLDNNLSLVDPNTILVKLNALSFFFIEVLGIDIISSIRKYKRDFKKKDFINLDEFNILVASVGERESLVYLILFETGFQLKEIISLRLTEIETLLSSSLYRRILKYCDKYGIEKKIFNITEETLRNKNRENTVKFLGKHYSFNDLRHSIALEKYLKKGDEAKAQEYLGNKTLASIRQYYRRAGYDYTKK
ncbi:MAG: hypothetical protein CR959_02080 [Fusobacteriales bacterium]|nr:MAG: hypothetical protein CR959_02080 [Fusobacteriales bacterium]